MLDMRKKEDREKIRKRTEVASNISINDDYLIQLLDLADERDELAKKCEILGRAYQDLENKLLAQIERRMELEANCKRLSDQLKKFNCFME